MIEAPRWRLIEPHYLRIPELPDGTRIEWEHKETARETGRTVRKLYPVPMLLDPNAPADHNYPGEIIVSHFVEGATIPVRDYIFADPPTPGMEPLNAAAEEITAKCRQQWDHPIESLPINGGMTPAESVFMQQMMEAFAKVAPPPVTQSVLQADYDELKERLAKLEASLAQQAKPSTERRV